MRRSTVLAILGLAAAVTFAPVSAQAQAQGDPAAGEKVFRKCMACHTVEQGKHRVGPSLFGVVGRQAAAAEGFKYSEAMKKAEITWTPENLHKYLTNPREFIPGNKMVFVGLKDEKERQDVIAYLQQFSQQKTGAVQPGERLAIQAADAQQTAAAATEEVSGRLTDRQGKQIGTVTLTGAPEGVLVQVEAEGLPPGPHGFHIHQTGACEPPFQSAGGHWDPTGGDHGFLDGNRHLGDLPNLVAGQEGRAAAEFFVAGASLSGGEQAILDEDGAAIVVHAQPDDYRTDPAGNAGDRIACAVIARG